MHFNISNSQSQIKKGSAETQCEVNLRSKFRVLSPWHKLKTKMKDFQSTWSTEGQTTVEGVSAGSGRFLCWSQMQRKWTEAMPFCIFLPFQISLRSQLWLTLTAVKSFATQRSERIDRILLEASKELKNKRLTPLMHDEGSHLSVCVPGQSLGFSSLNCFKGWIRCQNWHFLCLISDTPECCSSKTKQNANPYSH